VAERERGQTVDLPQEGLALGKGSNRRLVPPRRGGLGLFFDGFPCLTWGGYPDTHGTMPRAMRVEFPGAIYHVKGSVNEIALFC
jgi:hypothetical protein